MSKQIWVDFTDMLLWSGHLTGTQRVTYEYGKRLHKHHKNVSFFAFDEKNCAFYSVPFEKIEQVIESSIASLAPTETESVEQSSETSLKHTAKVQAIRVYQSVPYKYRQRLTPEHKEFVKKVYRKLTSSNRGGYSSLKKMMDTSQSLHFGVNDHVVLLGKPWDTMKFVELLKEQKLEANFKLTHLIYDMTPVFLPHVFGYPLPQNYTKYMFEAISLSDQLIAISEATKRDTGRFCKEELIPTPPISVVRIGDVLPVADSSIEAVGNLSPNKYILCVGTIEIRKNHILLYTAYKEAETRGIELPKLVIVGKKGWYTEDVMQQVKNDPEIKKKVTVIPSPTDTELDWLYRNCRFTVYPSVYEGWGLPIAESLAYGKVAVASNTSSMPEVGGGLVDYFSPYDSVACMEAIANYNNIDLLKKRESKIKTTYRPMTWDASYQSIDHLFKD